VGGGEASVTTDRPRPRARRPSPSVLAPCARSRAPLPPLATGNGMRAIVPILCMSGIVAGGNAYRHLREVERDEHGARAWGPGTTWAIVATAAAHTHTHRLLSLAIWVGALASSPRLCAGLVTGRGG